MSFQKVLWSAIDFVIVKTKLEGRIREAPLVRLRRKTSTEMTSELRPEWEQRGSHIGIWGKSIQEATEVQRLWGMNVLPCLRNRKKRMIYGTTMGQKVEYDMVQKMGNNYSAWGLVEHLKNLGFTLSAIGNLLESFKQGSGMIWFSKTSLAALLKMDYGARISGSIGKS